MLSLAAPSDPAWIARALDGLDEVLLDHAHCEKKAAGMAVQLLFRHPEHRFLQEPLSRLGREELGHFEQLLGILDERGIAFRRQKPSPYAGTLRGEVRTAEPERLIDTLLCSALIEARSCERLGLLGDAAPDEELARFYRALLASEARHHGVYVELACGLGPEAQVRARLAALALREAEVLAETPPWPRMHC